MRHRKENVYWKKAPAKHLSVLIDAADYFREFAKYAARARRRLVLFAWDIDSRILLWQGDPPKGVSHPPMLGEFLHSILDAAPELEIFILYWEPALVYRAERESLAEKQRRFAHPRLHFTVDDLHPAASCQHAKIAVIDDKIAFAGGIDLSRDRWDTSEHLANDPRRINPLGKPYRPFHDAHLVMDGPIARELGAFVARRVERVVGIRLPSLPEAPSDFDSPVDFEDVTIAISRTEPPFGEREGVYEIKSLLQTMVERARHFLFIETQYLTSDEFVDRLIDSLQRPHGPEIVAVCPLECTGFWEEVSMGVLRAKCLERLTVADRHSRFRVYYPVVSGIGEDFVAIHSKILIADDRLFTLGSANLSNRSLGVDYECNLTIEGVDESTRDCIASVRYRLLGEHLGVDPADLRERMKAHGSLIKLIEEERHASAGRTLVPLEVPKALAFVSHIVPEEVDPRHPVRTHEVFQIEERENRRSWAQRLRGAVPLAILVLIGFFWQVPSIREQVNPQRLMETLSPWTADPLAPVVALAGFVLGGIIFFPLMLLLMTTVVVFDPFPAFFLCLGGALLSASTLYAAGSRFGSRFLPWVRSRKLKKVRGKLKDQGIVTIMVLRLMPVVPFSLFNFVCGSLKIRFSSYFWGTLFGMLPGIAFLTVLKKISVDYGDFGSDPVRLFLFLAGSLLVVSFFISLWVGLRARRQMAKMRRVHQGIRIFVPLLLLLPSFARADEIYCDRFHFKGDIDFTSSEEVFLCGEKTGVWKSVPVSQATYHLRSFLETRGYYAPKLVDKDGLIHVTLGPQTKVTAIRSKGDPGFNLHRLDGIRGNVLSPKILDTTKALVKGELEEQGYPCHEIALKADSKTGEIFIDVEKGEKRFIDSIEREPVEGVWPQAITRFDAFQRGGAYRKSNLLVTSQRILDVSLVYSAFFAYDCQRSVLKQNFVSGPARLVSFGVGADTEQLLLFRASWKSSRLGYLGSQLSAALSTSFRAQELTSDFKWYIFPTFPRYFIWTGLSAKRENIDPYDRMTLQVKSGGGLSLDWDRIGFLGFLGPSGTFNYTRRGEGPRQAAYLSLNGHAMVTSHDFELYRASPTTGFQVRIESDVSHRSVLSSITAYQFRVTFENNWNISNTIPPVSILSVRTGFSTTISPEGPEAVPSHLRYFLGGSPDVRGFSLREIPGTTKGALTAWYAGVENRYPQAFPLNFQPFLFVDVGGTAETNFSLAKPLYWSPGFGIRWQSQIGVIRANFARGFVTGPSPVKPHWQLYLSYGEEF